MVSINKIHISVCILRNPESRHANLSKFFVIFKICPGIAQQYNAEHISERYRRAYLGP